MPLTTGVHEMTVQQANVQLQEMRATPVRKDATRQVYISKAHNLTFTITATRRPGVLRVQVTGGCVC